MPRICIKTRKNGRTVQMVRHIYDPTVGRSRTVTLGSIAVDADPDDIEPNLRLRLDVVLADEDRKALSAWLEIHGDRQAARRRQERAMRIEAEARKKVLAELAAQAGDAFEQSIAALDALISALPGLVEKVRAQGKEPRAILRKRYLAVNAASDRLLAAAQACGIAKISSRIKRHSTAGGGHDGE